MADRAQPLGKAGVAGIAVATAVPVLILATALAVVWRAEPGRGLSPADWAALRFTLWQAAVSSVLSVLLAIGLARALARRRFPGRGLVITLLGAPFLLPTIVAIFGLVAIFGRNGFLNAALAWLGLPEVSIYGAHGVILAHVFYNLPLATRLLLQGWQSIPSERFRLAASLDLGPRAIFRHLEWPMLRRVVPGALLVIFVICTTSFAVALTLGGGPRATTVELAIYQALRFEFDLARAALLSVIQLVITATAALIALRHLATPGFGPGLDRPAERWDAAGPGPRLLDGALIAVAVVFLVLPPGTVVAKGFVWVPGLPTGVWMAALRSVLVAMSSTALVVMAALTMSLATARLRGSRWIEAAGLLAIAASPLVLGTGLFILIFPFADPTGLALPVTVLVNALVTLPFALRAILPALATVESDFGRTADMLGVTGWARLRLLILPRLRPPLGFAAGLAAALSMGDLGVIALFSDPSHGTLPLQVYNLLGSYRTGDAGGAAVLLLGLSFAMFWLFDAWGRRRAQI